MENRDWYIKTLNEISSKIGDGLHGTPKYSNNGEYFFINGNNLVNGAIVFKQDTKKVNKEEFLKYRKELNESTIFVSINGTLGNLSFYKEEKVVLGKSAAYVNLLDTVDKIFVYYNFKSKYFQNYLIDIATGTTIPNVPLKGLREYDIQLPPLSEQKAIAGVLSSLDNKIDLLHQQNQTLEALAETLFRQWFIEEAKEDWGDCLIGDLATHSKVSIHPKKNLDTLYHHYSIPSFDANKTPVTEFGNEIQSNKYKVGINSILFSKLNPHKDKRVWLILDEIEDNAICSTEFQVVKPTNDKYLYFLFGWLTNSAYYNEIASGVGGTSGSHQRIDPKAIFTAPCVKIEEQIIIDYNIQAEPLFRKQFENQQQIQTLTQIRDTLLPKLMSGEVRVKY
ncbi:restriction endonuclease subunit S [Sphingobacterium sp. xlx-130]|uniref:restriction endonuclease subunit S n=1 Tax=Sphingobacterium sp. xlx-130 TaxID=2654323 RepID=UPI0013DCADAC|nr:restriction endonuclease subunit S [Sphingobacterium sp. xlx-130]